MHQPCMLASHLGLVTVNIRKPNGHAWAFARVLCDRSEAEEVSVERTTMNQSNEFSCSLSHWPVIDASLRRVTRCWKRKFHESAPAAWRHLVAADGSSTRQTFEHVYRRRTWAGRADSTAPLSGSGSSLRRTEAARRALMETIHHFGITRVIDAPCGDLNWVSSLFPAFARLNLSYHGDYPCARAFRTRVIRAPPCTTDRGMVDSPPMIAYVVCVVPCLCPSRRAWLVCACARHRHRHRRHADRPAPGALR